MHVNTQVVGFSKHCGSKALRWMWRSYLNHDNRCWYMKWHKLDMQSQKMYMFWYLSLNILIWYWINRSILYMTLNVSLKKYYLTNKKYLIIPSKSTKDIAIHRKSIPCCFPCKWGIKFAYSKKWNWLYLTFI